jgi:hypothetical protein
MHHYIVQLYLYPAYECSVSVNNWVRGTYFLDEIVKQINQFCTTLNQLHQFKEKKLLIPKPTLSSFNVLVFWVHESIIDDIAKLHGVQVGFQVSKINRTVPDSLNSKRVLFDIGCDSPQIVQKVSALGIEVISLWEHINDLYHYEILDLCYDRKIDFLVTINDRLFISGDTWLDYLKPSKTCLVNIPSKLLEKPDELISTIYNATVINRRKNQSIFHKNEEEGKKMKSANIQLEGLSTLLPITDAKLELESSLKDFVNQWNQYTRSGKDPTEFMKEKFNIIQKFHDEPLVGITGEDFTGIKLLYRDPFVINLEELIENSFNSKRFCCLYERYLEAIGEIILPSKRRGLAKERGLNSLLIRIDDPKLNLKGGDYFIKNSRASGQKLGVPQFNPWGYNYFTFCSRKNSTASNLVHLLMEEVNIEKILFLQIIHNLRKKISGSKGDIGIPTKIYMLKRSKNEIKEILRYALFRSIQEICKKKIESYKNG